MYYTQMAKWRPHPDESAVHAEAEAGGLFGRDYRIRYDVRRPVSAGRYLVGVDFTHPDTGVPFFAAFGAGKNWREALNQGRERYEAWLKSLTNEVPDVAS
jgi:hypothetical protein